jgi:ribonuclease D
MLAQDRLKKLKEWRLKKAGVGKPFQVLSNKTIEEIAEGNPQTIEALAAIPGMGPVKMEQYGEELLSLLRSNIEVDMDFGAPVANNTHVKDTHTIRMPAELKPYVADSDRFFSPLRQIVFAQERYRIAQMGAVERGK